MSTAERRQTIIRVVTLSGLAFLILLSYEFARPATESLFLAAHSVESLPYVWLLVGVGVTLTVAGYARLLAQREILSLLGGSALVSSIVLAGLLVARRQEVPFVHYALYVWKDIYIVLLVETFYCYANVVFPIKTARWIYGLFGAVASLGAIAGGQAVELLAPRLGTANILWFVVPINVLMWLVCLPFSRYAGASRPAGEQGENRPDLRRALHVISRSRYILLLVLLIAVVQIVVNLVDYEFNKIIQQAYPETDARTAMIAQVYKLTNTVTFVLHALTGPALRLLGVPAVLLLVPALLGIGAVVFQLRPTVTTAATLKLMSKCFDYTIFRAAKELLYIPLSFAEKTQGKSVVDVLTYRVAKGGASALILLLQRLALVVLISPFIMLLLVLWLTVIIARRFRRHVSRAEELGHQRRE